MTVNNLSEIRLEDLTPTILPRHHTSSESYASAGQWVSASADGEMGGRVKRFAMNIRS